MASLLVLGNSNILKRRALPAILATQKITQVDIGTRRPDSESPVPSAQQGQIFSSYESAINSSKAEYVYISLANSAHNEWARAALLSGRHVIIDKPAFTDLANAEELVNLSEKKNLLLAEATVYAYHPQVQALQKLFSNPLSPCTRVFAQFSVPPFTADNFRYQKKLGGGALLDLGPYAVSVARLFLPETPQSVHCRILSKKADVEIAFSLSLEYTDGKSLIGTFGFDTEYSNHLRLLGPQACASVDRIFTNAPDQNQNITYRSQNKESQITVPAADSFAEFFKTVFQANKQEQKQFKANLLADARLLHQMTVSATKENP